jgi:hypothetical protein
MDKSKEQYENQKSYNRGLTNYTKHSPSYEAERVSASKRIPCILWKSEVQYGIHNSPPAVPVLTQI